MLKVINLPVVIAKQPELISNYLRDFGVEARWFEYKYEKNGNYLKYKSDIVLDLSAVKSPINRVKMKLVALKDLVLNYNIFIFHYGKTLLPFYLDLFYLKLKGKKIVFQYHGSELRNPWDYVVPFTFIEKLNYLRRQMILKIVDKLFSNLSIVTTPDLLRYRSVGHYIPVAIDEFWFAEKSIQNTKSDKIVILHAPTDRIIKGTKYIMDTIDVLKKEGFNIELKLIENMPYEQVLQNYKEADIVVDQLHFGWYGMFSAEAMALRLPVLCYIDHKLAHFTEGLPIIPVTRKSLRGALIRLINNAELRKVLGDEGYNYSKKYHSPSKIAQQYYDLLKAL